MMNGTFSIVARCPKTGMLGVATSTGVPFVRSRVPFAEANVGAIATQANTNILYGVKGLALLKEGLSPKDALSRMLKEDLLRETRQVIMIDKYGRTAAFTGKETFEWKGHKIGKEYVVAGNMLVGEEVIEAMAEAFEKSSNMAFPKRLVKCLEAGEKVGGDIRGGVSAALIVVSPSHFTIDLKVDNDPRPVEKLKELLEKAIQA